MMQNYGRVKATYESSQDEFDQVCPKDVDEEGNERLLAILCFWHCCIDSYFCNASWRERKSESTCSNKIMFRFFLHEHVESCFDDSKLLNTEANLRLDSSCIF